MNISTCDDSFLFFIYNRSLNKRTKMKFVGGHSEGVRKSNRRARYVQERGREGQEICHRKTQENIWLSGQPSGTGQVLWHRFQVSSRGGGVWGLEAGGEAAASFLPQLYLVGCKQGASGSRF